MRVLKISLKRWLLVILSSFSIVFLSCQKAFIGPVVENTPVDNFNVIWNEFDRYYALFPIKNIDWQRKYAEYRPKVNNAMSDDELWNVVTSMLSRLNDVHVILSNNDASRIFTGGILEGKKPDKFDINVVVKNYLNNQYYFAADNSIVYGAIPGSNIGYLYISTFTQSPKSVEDIDRVIEEFKGKDALIIDIRNNGGGATYNYQYLAAAFIDKSIHYLDWQARSGPGHNDFENAMPLIVSSATGKNQFTKKIVLLTNRFSASSSDHFALIFKNLSYSIQIGDTTAGGFGSIARAAQMPNGWFCYFPLRLAKTPDGKCYEGIGIAPDITVVNEKGEIEKGIDRQLEYAVSYLRGSK